MSKTDFQVDLVPQVTGDVLSASGFIPRLSLADKVLSQLLCSYLQEK